MNFIMFSQDDADMPPGLGLLSYHGNKSLSIQCRQIDAKEHDFCIVNLLAQRSSDVRSADIKMYLLIF